MSQYSRQTLGGHNGFEIMFTSDYFMVYGEVCKINTEIKWMPVHEYHVRYGQFCVVSGCSIQYEPKMARYVKGIIFITVNHTSRLVNITPTTEKKSCSCPLSV